MVMVILSAVFIMAWQWVGNGVPYCLLPWTDTSIAGDKDDNYDGRGDDDDDGDEGDGIDDANTGLPMSRVLRLGHVAAASRRSSTTTTTTTSKQARRRAKRKTENVLSNLRKFTRDPKCLKVIKNPLFKVWHLVAYSSFVLNVLCSVLECSTVLLYSWTHETEINK